jgi:hypothetical protein
VDHQKLQAELNFVPAAADISPSPDYYYKQRIRWNCRNYGNSSIVAEYCMYGLLASGMSATTDNTVQFMEGGAYDFTVMKLISSTYGSVRASGAIQSGQRIIVDKIQRKFDKIVSSKATYLSYTNRRLVDISKFMSDWSEVTLSILEAAWDSGTIYGTYTQGAATQFLLKETATGSILSIPAARSYVDATIVPLLDSAPFPLKDADYGTMASNASAKVNANQVNMIAFLRDLRRPQEMIPKLKKLRELKTHASNYLAINYGVLPTISDLQNIVAAFKKSKPFLDRNGWKTYTDVYHLSSSDSNYQYELENRIKLAIEDEDSEWSELFRSIESSGFALTAENVWDLIPYSFVVDWFINVGDFLERVDSRLRLSRLNIRYVTMSRKSKVKTVIRSSVTFPFVGSAELVRYQRWTSDLCPVPPLFFQNTPTVSNHWLEASALIIQRAKTK